MDYNIYYGPSSTYSSNSRITLPRFMDTMLTITGLESDTAYSIQVAANNLEGLGPLHESIQIITLIPGKIEARSNCTIVVEIGMDHPSKNCPLKSLVLSEVFFP